MKAFALQNPQNSLDHLDVVIDHHLDFKQAYKLRQDVKTGDFKVALLSLPQLIKMKQLAGRPKDKIDIEVLKKIEKLKNEK